MAGIIPRPPLQQDNYIPIRSNYSNQGTEKSENLVIKDRQSIGIFDSKMNTSIISSAPNGSIQQSSIMASTPSRMEHPSKLTDGYPEQP